MHNVQYTCTSHPYVRNPGAQAGQAVVRPWVEVAVSYGSFGPHRLWCLVDTGADNVLLDPGTAIALNIDRFALPKSNVSLANGSSSGFGECQGVTLDFAGTRVNTTVLFGKVAVPLLGRSALLENANSPVVGFEAGQWLHD